jgi:hypothetical protein
MRFASSFPLAHSHFRLPYPPRPISFYFFLFRNLQSPIPIPHSQFPLSSALQSPVFHSAITLCTMPCALPPGRRPYGPEAALFIPNSPFQTFPIHFSFRLPHSHFHLHIHPLLFQYFFSTFGRLFPRSRTYMVNLSSITYPSCISDSWKKTWENMSFNRKDGITKSDNRDQRSEV